MRGIIKNVAEKWKNFWFPQMDPFILGIFRIALGSYLLLYYIMLGPKWLTYFLTTGDAWVYRWPTSYQIFDSVLFFINTAEGLWLFYICAILSAIALILGIGRKLPLIFLWVANFSIMHRHLGNINGEEHVLAILLWISLFLPLCSSNTIYHWLGKKETPKKVTGWSIRVLQIYIALLILLNMTVKIQNETLWLSGEAVYYSIMSMHYARWPGLSLFTFGGAIISKILSWYTFIIEISFPFLSLLKRTRVPIVLCMMTIHIGLIIFLQGVWMFNLAMIVGLILFFPSKLSKQAFRAITTKIQKHT